MRILVCTDLSAEANAILPAVEMVARDEGEVVLVHVVDPRHVHASESSHHDESDVATIHGRDVFEGGGSPTMPLEARTVPAEAGRRAETRDQALQRAVAEARDRLAVLAADLPGKPRLAVLLGSDVAETVLALAKQEDADLIALATHAHRPATELLVGGVTQRLIRGGALPVLTMRPQ